MISVAAASRAIPMPTQTRYDQQQQPQQTVTKLIAQKPEESRRIAAVSSSSSSSLASITEKWKASSRKLTCSCGSSSSSSTSFIKNFEQRKEFLTTNDHVSLSLTVTDDDDNGDGDEQTDMDDATSLAIDDESVFTTASVRSSYSQHSQAAMRNKQTSACSASSCSKLSANACLRKLQKRASFFKLLCRKSPLVRAASDWDTMIKTSWTSYGDLSTSTLASLPKSSEKPSAPTVSRFGKYENLFTLNLTEHSKARNISSTTIKEQSTQRSFAHFPATAVAAAHREPNITTTNETSNPNSGHRSKNNAYVQGIVRQERMVFSEVLNNDEDDEASLDNRYEANLPSLPASAVATVAQKTQTSDENVNRLAPVAKSAKFAKASTRSTLYNLEVISEEEDDNGNDNEEVTCATAMSTSSSSSCNASEYSFDLQKASSCSSSSGSSMASDDQA